jgi:hypothetical protein
VPAGPSSTGNAYDRNYFVFDVGRAAMLCLCFDASALLWFPPRDRITNAAPTYRLRPSNFQENGFIPLLKK